MRVLLVGSGAREHALAWRLVRGPSPTELHAAPGNPGIAAFGACHPVRADDGEGLLDLARTVAADLIVIGPEAPLVAGVADSLRHAGLAVFGPGAEAARIEGSKAFAKDILEAAGVPAAATLAIARPPCVVKADGLAAGKGVFICRTQDELDAGLRAAAALGETVVVEELLEGPEVSLFALCDGRHAVPLGAAQDFKRALDGDAGPNTGGMGACSPVPWLPDAHVDADALVWRIHQPVLDELARHRGIAHRYAVVGQSWGGMLAMDYALDHPAGLRGIVVADSPASMTLWVSEANRLRGDLPPDVQETLTRHEEAARVAGRGGSGAMRGLVLPRRGPSA